MQAQPDQPRIIQTASLSGSMSFRPLWHCLTLHTSRTVQLTAAAFVVLLAAFETLYLQAAFAPAFNALRSNFGFPDLLLVIAFSILSLYLVFLFVLATLTSSWPYKVLYILIFTFAVTVEYGYAKAIGHFTTGFDLRNALSATSDQQLFSIAAYVTPASIIPVAALLILSIALRNSSSRRNGIRFLIVVLATVGFYLQVIFAGPLLFQSRFVGLSLGTAFYSSVEYPFIEPTYTIARDPVEQPRGVLKRPEKNIVVVFDESIRGDHLSVNGYERETTPFLSNLQKQGSLTNFGIAVSGSTSSHYSYDAFISGATADEVSKQGFDRINRMPSIFQYAKAMGYETYFLDGQMTAYWGGLKDDTKFIDRYLSSKELGNPDWEKRSWKDAWKLDRMPTDELDHWEFDSKLAQAAKDIYSGSTGNFVFIYKRGIHVPYQNTYPADAAIWTPEHLWDDFFEIPSEEKRSEVVNSYDNAILYNLDTFFKSLSSDYGNLANTVIIYTSDHGQTLYANGASPHGGKSKAEATVPLIFFGVDKSRFDTSFKASHANVFTTLLDIMEYPVDERKYPYAITLFNAKASDSSPRYFNPGPDGKVPFDK